jgi:GT2 family glycosyltransferase
MKIHPPYHIKHIRLQDDPAPIYSDPSQTGSYLIFWWNDIALGDLYLEPNKKLSKKEYYRLMRHAILPALRFYATEQQHLLPDWQELLPDDNYKTWITTLEALFLNYTCAIVAESVPVSVIICTHNRVSQLHQCLTNLSKLACKAAEIIVVDNAPTDEATETTVKQFTHAGNLVYVKEPRKGLDIARNTGLKHATYPVVAFVDDDVTVHHLWLHHVWETFRNPKIAAMTGLVLASELQTEAQCIFEKHWSFNRGYADKIYTKSFLLNTHAQGPPVWEIGAGANMAFRKDVLKATGTFNELLDAGAAGCSGDSELWYRLLLHGYTIHYNPRAIVYHQHRKDIKSLRKQIFYYMRGHAAAALIQQKQYKGAAYTQHLTKLLLKGYTRSILKGFPSYQARYTTLWAQISGVLSGLIFYYKNR